ncbi:uncharacterized protein LOC103720282 [Phoenix dactylifera]|uniref:Uncharacterized protein LOC103720282 n=1 Tax=Phoenix dactylifera TaxID=42345 RepID=A0A8B7CWM6_PHODC|nr:uncharacterized protein LOC103720282 [Phoenix dactylifera]XP_008808127.1 uncharacterized protein LOC103720282 [Phoenix dactylifera]XP_008808128.1 uncharacterized protein LOC103720282 [Phoenix dactylifera]XP_008808130.1 uncharacterized protein LOC103720282 [Phoenix dactylifera]XP_038973384.1 uncharacterized protein LOC103720282 [Phoenix dactylifera]
MATREEERVHPDCVNSSNPYHQCTEICFKKIGDAKDPNKRRDRSVQNGERRKDQEQGIMASGVRGNVDPLCVNASNPYHICAEYCSNKRTTEATRKQTGGGRSVDNKEGFDMGQNRKVDPKCINASNPYHICADYCFQKMHEKERAKTGKPVVVGGQKKDGLNMLERRDVHPKCVKASNPYHKCAEYCFQGINETM